MSRDDVQLYLMCADEIWKLFEDLPTYRKRRFTTGSIYDYYNFISQLDIGIAPLQDTPFNAARSDLKVYEYAANGVVPVVQATGPYLQSLIPGRTGFFFSTPDELISTLDNLASDASARASVSRAAREYWLRERNCLNGGKDRVEYYRSLIVTARGGCTLSGDKAENTFARLTSCAGAWKSGRHLLLVRTRYELLMQKGIHESSLSIPPEAWNSFLEAMELEPSLYMPYLCGAGFSQDPIQMLKSALERNPNSIMSWINLGKAYSLQGMTAKALQSFKKATSIFPEYELSYIECANCLAEMGRRKEATAFLKKAIELIPGVIKTRSQAQKH